MDVQLYAGLLVGLVAGIPVGWFVSKASFKRAIAKEKERLRNLYKTTEKVKMERAGRPNAPGRRARVSTATHPRTTNRLDGES